MSNSYKYDNYTLYGIHDKTERQLLAVYSSGIFISSLIGDTLILIGSLRYKAIRLHKVMVVFIQYIAVADLALAIFRVLPGSVSLAANKWIFGEFFCNVGYCVTCSVGGTACLLISALSLTKLLIVKYPLRAISFSTRAAHFITLGLWLYFMFPPVIAIMVDKRGVYFNFLDYNCDYGQSYEDDLTGSIVCAAMTGLAGLISITITVVSSSMLIAIAKRVTERGPEELQWQGVMMVLLTVAVYSVATLPGAVYFLGSYLVSGNQPEVFHFWHVTLFRFSAYIAILNILANFYIYTLTLTSFREFLGSKIELISASLVRFCSPNESETADEDRERRRLLP